MVGESFDISANQHQFVFQKELRFFVPRVSALTKGFFERYSVLEQIQSNIAAECSLGSTVSRKLWKCSILFRSSLIC
jgi:hypothetical protein